MRMPPDKPVEPDAKESEGTKDVTTADATAPPATVPVSVLPEEIRGKSESELAVILDRMSRTTIEGAQAKQRVTQLEAQLAEARASATPRHARVEPEVPDDFDLTEAIVSGNEEDVEKAVLHVLAKRGLLGRFEQVESAIGNVGGETAMMRAQRELTDFDEYSETVEAIIRDTDGGGENPVPRTWNNVRGAYIMARGLKDLERAKKAALPADRPKEDLPQDLPKIDSLTAALSAEMGVSEADVLKYSSEAPLIMEVPGGRS
jgi:hypothetical protein